VLRFVSTSKERGKVSLSKIEYYNSPHIHNTPQAKEEE
jgi:hypothetical protein